MLNLMASAAAGLMLQAAPAANRKSSAKTCAKADQP
jgi:hypothetical protein